MRMFHLIVSLLGLFLVFQARAQSVTTKGHECSGDFVSTEYTCLNPRAGADIRFYMNEFQTCKNGSIESLDRSVTVISFGADNRDFSQDLSLQLSDKRTHMDDRDGDLSIVLPKSASATQDGVKVELAFTERTAPDYEGATGTSWHYMGSFKKTVGSTVEQGDLICSVLQ